MHKDSLIAAIQQPDIKSHIRHLRPILRKFRYLENRLYSVDVSVDETFQQTFMSVYCELVIWFRRFLHDESSRRVNMLFDRIYPDSGLPEVKKIEFVLWQLRR
ncbi:hypothetical protein ABNN70_06650 [Sporolactobacillus sp. Y61]|uniref:Uncharacterized protein n=1 Tax=Sporolactobacillus sp. Y61 TaxID=3160863 RepID=A0AAU8IIP0_9BACL